MDGQTEYFTCGDVAKAAGLTGQGVNYAVKRGELNPAGKTRGGIALFRPSDVEAYLEGRKQAGKRGG